MYSNYIQRKCYPIRVLLDNIRSLWNVGSILRTCDAINAEIVYLTGITGYPPRKEISKTALGAEDFINWEYHKDPVILLNKLKNKSIFILAVEQKDGAKSCFDFDIKFPVCIVVGNEIVGVRPEIIDLADLVVQIPMFGKKKSLNVSVAFGIIAYQILNKFKSMNF